ncbi:MAG: hypothetical protein H7246_21735 [Phycisphaerae bacterium]|nr:hypothetical protein [Saprospiraceae bacterium]
MSVTFKMIVISNFDFEKHFLNSVLRIKKESRHEKNFLKKKSPSVRDMTNGLFC